MKTHASVWIVQWFDKASNAQGTHAVFESEEDAKVEAALANEPSKPGTVYKAFQWIVTPKKK